jgi:hypothetical protein
MGEKKVRIVATLALGVAVAVLIGSGARLSGAAGDDGSAMAAGLFAGAAFYDIAAGCLAYFAPLWIALSRSHPEATPIAVVNLLFGWTVIGWLIAMLWALSRLPHAAPVGGQASVGS